MFDNEKQLEQQLSGLSPEKIEVEVKYLTDMDLHRATREMKNNLPPHVLKICFWENERRRIDELMARQIERSSAHLRVQKTILNVLPATLALGVLNWWGVTPASLTTALTELILR